VPKPPITIRCDCGVAGLVSYGQTWTCPSCARRWNTQQIPPEEYAVLTRRVRRYRLLALAPIVALTVTFIPLGLLVDFRFFVLLFVAGSAYVLLVIPRMRRRTMRDAGELPRWSLHPE